MSTPIDQPPGVQDASPSEGRNFVQAMADAAAKAAEHRAAERTQAFFQRLADEMRRPSYGDMARDFGRALLLRAQEANLYTPTENA